MVLIATDPASRAFYFSDPFSVLTDNVKHYILSELNDTVSFWESEGCKAAVSSCVGQPQSTLEVIFEP